MRLICFGIYILCVLAASAKADQFCFAFASTYYEQVYCQLQARAQTKNLPPFNQFKKNNEQVQFSLLKRPAERNAIKLPAPTPTVAPVTAKVLESKPEASLVQSTSKSSKPTTTNVSPEVVRSAANNSDCELQGKQLKCATGEFTLVGNKANRRLSPTALSADNKMSLPIYQGGVLSQYLASAYRQYIAKMDEIGLGGVTMTYKKFAYLYQDLQTKGLDFSQRFETMYGFLKKDKATMGVSESASVPQGLDASYCSLLDEQFYVCDLQGRNYIFAAR